MRTDETFQRTTRLSDGRYETGLLWRKEDVHHSSDAMMQFLC